MIPVSNGPIEHNNRSKLLDPDFDAVHTCLLLEYWGVTRSHTCFTPSTIYCVSLSSNACHVRYWGSTGGMYFGVRNIFLSFQSKYLIFCLRIKAWLSRHIEHFQIPVDSDMKGLERASYDLVLNCNCIFSISRMEIGNGSVFISRYWYSILSIIVTRLSI